MKNLLLLLFLLITVDCFAQSGITVYVPLSTGFVTPATNRTVNISPMSAPTVNSASVVLPGAIQETSDPVNGNVIITNAIIGGLYSFKVLAPPALGQFQILIPTNAIVGSNNGSGWLVANSTATFPAGTVAWSTAASDARYAAVGSGGTDTNAAHLTNASLQTFVGPIAATSFAGDGSALSGVRADRLVTGLSGTNLSIYNEGNQIIGFPSSSTVNFHDPQGVGAITLRQGLSGFTGDDFTFGQNVSAASFTGNASGLTNLTAANLTGIVPLANGGTANTTLSADRSSFGGGQFLGSDTSFVPTIANFGSLTGDYVGQHAWNARGQMGYWDGSNWQGIFQTFDTFYAYSTNFNHAFIVSNGVDNVLSLQNLDPRHYSAVRFLDSAGAEIGAAGYGNTNASIYRTNLFFESFGGTTPIWFSGGGNVYGGLEGGGGGDFVWWNQTSGAATNNYASLSQLFRIHRATGLVTVNSNLNVGGNIVQNGNNLTTSAGLQMGAADPATSLALNNNSQIHAGNFIAATNKAYSVQTAFDASGSGSGLNYSTASHGVNETEMGVAGVADLTVCQAAGNGYLSIPCVTIGPGCTNQGDISGFAALQVLGSFATQATAVSVNYAMTETNQTVYVTATGKVITLPDSTYHCKGRIYTVKLTSSGSCTVTNSSGSQNIDGALSYSLSAQYKYVTVQSDGTQWWVIANN